MSSCSTPLADELEHVEGRERENLEGWIPALATDAEIREALEKAFDYRGDVTITLKNGIDGGGLPLRPPQRADAGGFGGPHHPDAEGRARRVERVMVSYADIAALNFTGRDTAAGKTFEAWVKKYWEKKAAGETSIQIEPEKLD